MSTFVDIHVLQTVPPSNVNRDDTGSPKTAVYGGVTRARVSSQAWKRATRTGFQHSYDRSELGVRTKRIVELVAEQIQQIRPELAEPMVLAERAVAAAGFKVGPPKGKKDAAPVSEFLIFLSAGQVRHLAELAVEAVDDGDDAFADADRKKAAKAAADSDHSVDVALFGRMVATDPSMNVDAAAQVAHAISVHAVQNEFDYFTAVDDTNTEEETGAGMIGTVEFNSSTLYRYATVNVDGLLANLGDVEATRRAVGVFIDSFVRSMPTGKQNTFANRTLPDAVLVQVRDRQPVNLVQAFERPVLDSSDAGRIEQATQRLATAAQEVVAAYGGEPLAAFVTRMGEATAPLDAVGQRVPLEDLCRQVEGVVAGRLAGA